MYVCMYVCMYVYVILMTHNMYMYTEETLKFLFFSYSYDA